MDGVLAVVAKDVFGGIHETFTITPSYWVAAYQNLEIGSVISEVQTIGDPQPLIFQPGTFSATATLIKVGSLLKIVLS